MTREPNREDDAVPAEERTLPNSTDDAPQALPEILEVFGSAPLVQEPGGVAQDDTSPTEEEEASSGDEMPEVYRLDNGPTIASTPAAEAPSVEPPEEPAAPPAAAEPPPAPVAQDAPAAVNGNGSATRAAASGPDSAQLMRMLAEQVDAAFTRTSGQLLAGMQELRELLSLTESRVGRLEESLEGVAKQASFIPPKLRGLGKKLDDLATSLADARCRELLEDLVAMTDLVGSALADFPEDADDATADKARRFFNALGTRMSQVLESNQLETIPTDVPFDPALHHAAERVAVSDPTLDGAIVEVYRKGWRTEHAVLRYADVAVGHYEEGAAPAAAEDPAVEVEITPSDEEATTTDPTTVTDAMGEVDESAEEPQDGEAVRPFRRSIHVRKTNED